MTNSKNKTTMAESSPPHIEQHTHAMEASMPSLNDESPAPSQPDKKQARYDEKTSPVQIVHTTIFDKAAKIDNDTPPANLSSTTTTIYNPTISDIRRDSTASTTLPATDREPPAAQSTTDQPIPPPISPRQTTTATTDHDTPNAATPNSSPLNHILKNAGLYTPRIYNPPFDPTRPFQYGKRAKHKTANRAASVLPKSSSSTAQIHRPPIPSQIRPPLLVATTTAAARARRNRAKRRRRYKPRQQKAICQLIPSQVQTKRHQLPKATTPAPMLTDTPITTSPPTPIQNPVTPPRDMHTAKPTPQSPASVFDFEDYSSSPPQMHREPTTQSPFSFPQALYTVPTAFPRPQTQSLLQYFTRKPLGLSIRLLCDLFDKVRPPE